MKNTKKIFLVLLAMLAAFTLASCKAADDDDDKKSSVTTVATFYGMGKETGSYEGTEVLFTANIKATFYSNKEYKIDATINAIVSGNSKEKLISQDGTIEIGTYTGDPTKNGQIKTTATKEYDDKSKKLVAVKTKKTDSVEIRDGGKIEIDLNSDGEFNDFGITTFDITLKRQ